MTGRARSTAARSPILHVRAGIAWLTLPRPRVDLAVAQQLCDAAAEVAHDESVRVAVVRAAGRDFCLGVADPGTWEQRHDWVAAIGRLAVPVLAAVRGKAVAEGCELALACDLRLTAAGASFCLPQLGEGRLPSHGATQRLPRLLGRTRALELLLSGRHVDAREAERIGLATRLVPAARLATAVRATADELAAKGPHALRLAKEAVTRGPDLSFEQGVRFEQDLYVLLQTTADRAEGIRAFLGKRRPRFRGR